MVYPIRESYPVVLFHGTWSGGLNIYPRHWSEYGWGRECSVSPPLRQWRRRAPALAPPRTNHDVIEQRFLFCGRPGAC